jgi:hypothetical protein
MRNKFQNKNQVLKTKEKSAIKSSWSVSGVKMEEISALETFSIIRNSCYKYCLPTSRSESVTLSDVDIHSTYLFLCLTL